MNQQEQPTDKPSVVPEPSAELEAQRAIDLINRVRRFQREKETFAGDDQTVSDFKGSLTDLPMRFGEIEIVEQIGVGGFGIVFRGLDHRLNREVAVKIPKIRASISQQFRTRFEREAFAAAALSHPNIVPVFEAGTFQSTPFIASQFVSGPLLDEWADSKPIEPDLAARMVSTLADAVAHAHQRGIFHRDIKPSNVLVENVDASPNADVSKLLRLTDFGLAKMLDDDSSQTKTGSLIGTPAYMAPEMIESPGNVNAQVDIYSLGCLLYELLSGQPPFVGKTVVATLDKVRKTEPRPPSAIHPVPRDLEAICLKCLKKVPSERYESAIDLRSDLQRFLGGEPVVARRPGVADRLFKWTKRNPIAVALLGTIVLATLVSGALLRRSELLRRESESNRARLEAKSEQLARSINGFYMLMANSPELDLAGLDPLKRRLLVQVRTVRSELVEESADDPESQIELWQTHQLLASLTLQLGDRKLAMQQVDESIQQIESASVELKNRFEVAKVQAGCLMISAAAGKLAGDARRTREPLEKAVEIARGRMRDFGKLEDQELLASTLADAAALLSAIGDINSADKMSKEALDAWRELPLDVMNPEDVERYSSVLLSRIKAAAQLTGPKSIEISEELANEARLLWDLSSNPSVRLQWNCGEIFRVRAFTLRNTPDRSEEAIADAEKALEIATGLAESQLWTASMQRTPSVSRYSLALLHYIYGSTEIAVPLFETNIEALEKCKQRFPEDADLVNQNLSNNLTMLSIYHKNKKNWAEQSRLLDMARELLLERHDPDNPEPAILVLLAGQNLERAANRVHLDQLDIALEYIDDALAMLESETIVLAGGEQAARYLRNAIFLKIDVLINSQEYAEAQSLLDERFEFEDDLATFERLRFRLRLAFGEKDDTAVVDLLEQCNEQLEMTDSLTGCIGLCETLAELWGEQDGLSDSVVQSIDSTGRKAMQRVEKLADTLAMEKNVQRFVSENPAVKRFQVTE